MRALDRISGNNFLVVGRAGMDFFPTPAGTAIRHATEFSSGLGGSSANIAVAICKQGGQAALVTTVSDDAVGAYCRQQLENYGVSTAHVRTIKGEARTSLAVYESRIEGHQTVIYRNNAADFQMDLQDVEAPDYARYSGVITTGTVFAAEPSRTAGYRALELAEAAGLPVIFDIDYRPYSWASAQLASEVLTKAAEMSDIIIGNDEEFDFVAGTPGAGLALARELGRSPDRITVYKMGEAGSITFTGGAAFATGIYPVEALKPTGAGDSFMGGFIASLAAGRPLPDCVARGSANAAIVVSRPGCAPAMEDTAGLDAFIAAHAGLSPPPEIPT
ncbi:MAG: 5-dehydro-2-deoxygluconokinase [Pseudomonadota bacterium]